MTWRRHVLRHLLSLTAWMFLFMAGVNYGIVPLQQMLSPTSIAFITGMWLSVVGSRIGSCYDLVDHFLDSLYEPRHSNETPTG